MKHVYDPKEYPYGNRIDDRFYEFYPTIWQESAETLKDFATLAAHNVREAYPSLTVAAVDLTIPLVLTLTVEGQRVDEHRAITEALIFALGLRPMSAAVRAYSSTLKEDIGLILRDVHLHVPQPSVLKAPTPAERAHPEGWDA